MAKPAKRYPKKSQVMNFRIQPGTRALLQKAAIRSGRTISAECEHQLQRALSDLGRGPSHAVMAVIGRTIDDLIAMRERSSSPEQRRAEWWTDPYTYRIAEQILVSAFNLFRPQGEFADGETGRQGEFAIETTLREIQLADLSIPFDQMSPHQRWLALLRRDLGELADRPVIWGASARKTRATHERARSLLRELIPLSKKAAKTPETMSPADNERLKELRRQIHQISQGEAK